MAQRQYPRSLATMQRNWRELPENQGPRCLLCSRKALFSVVVEVNWFRGDDVTRLPACLLHRSNHAQALLDAKEAQ